MTDFMNNLGDNPAYILGHVLKITIILGTYRNNLLEN